MSALGHKQTYAVQKGMSALPPISDIDCVFRHVCFGPQADISYSSINRTVRSEESEWGNREAQHTGSL